MPIETGTIDMAERDGGAHEISTGIFSTQQEAQTMVVFTQRMEEEIMKSMVATKSPML